MADLLRKTFSLVEDLELKDLERTGQNFLIDEDVIEMEVSAAGLVTSDIVLDIGAGFGFVLDRIRVTCGVIAIEKDPVIYSYLLKRHGLDKNVGLINADALGMHFPAFTKTVSNPPYDIADRILKKLTGYDFARGVMVLPKTLSDSLLGSSGKPTKFATIMREFFKFERLMEVKKDAFYPAPRVTSAMLRFDKKPFGIVQAVLLKDKMTVKNAILRSAVELWASSKRDARKELSYLVEKLAWIAGKRVRSLSAAETIKLSDALNAHSRS